MATLLAAMAPENPATNDVHPVRNPATGPYASRRYIYSPPASGRSGASSAYAHEGESAAEQPDQENRLSIGDEPGDENGHEENAAADDVRDNDRGGVQ